MSDNPFAEPEDDRTVFRPSPGGQRPGARPATPRTAMPPADVAPPVDRATPVRTAPPAPVASPARVAPAVASGADLQTLVGAFSNPLIAAAAPLLALLSHLSNSAAPPDQGDMRDRTARELREFERRGREAGVPMEQMRPAHYALCAALDDVVLNTPWGAHGRWRERTLSATFHGESEHRATDQATIGDGFFDQIRLMRADPAKHLHVLELMYLCLSLGFMGRFRQAPDGAERMERILDQTYGLIRTARAEALPALAEHWAGVDAPYRPRRARFPIWVAAALALAVVAGGFVWVLDGLNARSDGVLAAALAASPAAMPTMLRPPSVRPPPPPPEPPPPGPAEKLRQSLATEIGRHEMEILETPSSTIVRLPARVLFPANNAALSKPAEALLAKLGQALKALPAGPQPGAIQVLGYTDDRQTRTVKFPSNFALSKARAEAVARGIGGGAADGRADADPVAPNTTAEGREQNRRVDVVLPR